VSVSELLTTEQAAERMNVSAHTAAGDRGGLLGVLGHIEVLGEWSALDINLTLSKQYRAKVDDKVAAARAAIASIEAEGEQT
jgi:hypothetical protein